MYLLIEHNGSPSHVTYVKALSQHIEENFGATVEDIVGRFDEEITIYTIDLKALCQIDDRTPVEYVDYFIESLDED